MYLRTSFWLRHRHQKSENNSDRAVETSAKKCKKVQKVQKMAQSEKCKKMQKSAFALFSPPCLQDGKGAVPEMGSLWGHFPRHSADAWATESRTCTGWREEDSGGQVTEQAVSRPSRAGRASAVRGSPALVPSPGGKQPTAAGALTHCCRSWTNCLSAQPSRLKCPRSVHRGGLWNKPWANGLFLAGLFTCCRPP